MRVYLRPEAIRLAPAGTGARILGSTFAGATRRLMLAVEGLDEPLALSVLESGPGRPGDDIGLSLAATEACLVMPIA